MRQRQQIEGMKRELRALLPMKLHNMLRKDAYTRNVSMAYIVDALLRKHYEYEDEGIDWEKFKDWEDV